MSPNLMLIAGSLLIAASALCLTLQTLRDAARKVGAELRSTDADQPLESPRVIGNPTFHGVLGAVTIAATLPQIALGLGLLPEPIWVEGDAVPKIVVAVLMGTAIVALATLFQHIWVRRATVASGLSEVEVRQRLHQRNPMFVSAP